MKIMGTRKNTASHNPPGEIRPYGASLLASLLWRPLTGRARVPAAETGTPSRAVDGLPDAVPLLLFGVILEHLVLMGLGQVGSGGEDQGAVPNFRVLDLMQDDVLGRRHGADVPDEVGQLRGDGRLVHEVHHHDGVDRMLCM